MHNVRRLILFRWVFYFLSVLLVIGSIYVYRPFTPAMRTMGGEDFGTQPLEVLSEDINASIYKTIDALTHNIPTYGKVDGLNPSLVVIDLGSIEEGYKKPVLSTIFFSLSEKSVILNGKLYFQGDVLPDGRRLVKVNSKGAFLAVGSNLEHISWEPAFRVELKRAGSNAQAGNKKANPQNVLGSSSVDQDTPEDLSPEEAIDLMDKLGRAQK